MGIRHIPGEALTIGEYYRLQEKKEKEKTLPRAIPEPKTKPKKELTEAQKESRRKALEKWNKKRRVTGRKKTKR